MATIQEILDKINASKSNNVNNNSFIDLMRQISGNPEDAIAPVNDTNSIYGHIVQMYTTLYDSGIDYAILADEVDMLQGVYDNLIAINSVDADKTKLDSIYADKTKLDQLFADKAVIDRVYGSISNIDRVHTSIDKLDTVYVSVLKMDMVADNITDVNTVADNIAVLNEIYDNRVEIYAADDNAVIATTKAIEASNSAATALGYKNDVSAMKLAVETIYDTFDDRFLGTKAIDPTVDNDGNALLDGAMYFNTTDNAMKVYDAGTTTWYSIPQIYLSGLLDVELISITTGDILVWNGTKWSNTANPKVDSIQFNGGSGTEGTVSWNSDEGTLDLVANTTTLQIGQETYIHVLNQSGSTILDGTVVMAVGTLGASGRILVQPYDGVSLPKYILGIATESLATGQSGKVTNFGKIRGLNTSAWNEGDELFVTINGGLTNVEPTTGINVAIAYVINKHASNGTIMVRFTPYDENLSYSKTEIDSSYGNVNNTSDLDKPVSTDTQTALDLKAPLTSAALVNPTINGIAQSGYSGFKNYITNGNFGIWQRGTSFSFVNELNSYHADRWLITQFGAGGTQTISQTSGVVDGGNDYALRCFQTTACNNKTVQILDNYSSQGLRGGKMTVSFWYRAKGNISSSMMQRTDTQTYSSEFDYNTPEGIGTAIGVASGLISDETWRYASYTTETTNQNGYFHLVFSQDIAINNYYELTRVQIEKGSVATPFEHRPIGLELSLCQRYYTQGRLRLLGWAGTELLASSILPTKMRTIPTMIGYSSPLTAPTEVVNTADTSWRILPLSDSEFCYYVFATASGYRTSFACGYQAIAEL